MITAYKYLKGASSKEEELFQVGLHGIYLGELENETQQTVNSAGALRNFLSTWNPEAMEQIHWKCIRQTCARGGEINAGLALKAYRVLVKIQLGACVRVCVCLHAHMDILSAAKWGDKRCRIPRA